MNKPVPAKKATPRALPSKRKMQDALRKEIERIDEKLNSLGLPPEIIYCCKSSIPNPETPQNTVNIPNMGDLSQLYRFLAIYENMYDAILKSSKELTGVANTEVCVVNGLKLRDVVHDLRLRIKFVSNVTTINALTQAKQKLMPFLDNETRMMSAIKEVADLYKNL